MPTALPTHLASCSTSTNAPLQMKHNLNPSPTRLASCSASAAFAATSRALSTAPSASWMAARHAASTLWGRCSSTDVSYSKMRFSRSLRGTGAREGAMGAHCGDNLAHLAHITSRHPNPSPERLLQCHLCPFTLHPTAPHSPHLSAFFSAICAASCPLSASATAPSAVATLCVAASAARAALALARSANEARIASVCERPK